ncbi:right-handed parallel beta-helix repeat-containing protein [Haladaptatus salinisoli]|uniref:right-handed parallel beta-helix repeat-containing protein n=1 Tax=Haladaptatus salinisoli TaxID=2884876 RepID=UPI001D0B3C9C|nr:right-handed parallel beta-helix repeat-containing protein [Haladaptatus salinisoli]
MGEEIWFTDKAYAEVSTMVADLLASQNDFINKVTAPSSPGTYYEDAPQNAQVTVELPSGAFDHLSADSFDIDGGIDLTDVTGADPLSVASLDSGSVDTEHVANVADYIVGSLSELEAAFANLSNGEIIYIGNEGAPYRTTSWLDVDGVSNVKIVGSGKTDLITVADEAGVGGIRIGNTTQCTDVHVSHVGVDGNKDNQTGTGQNLHGFSIHNGKRITVENCIARNLYPYHEHGTGGSGISVEGPAESVKIHNNWIDNTGDRSIESHGTKYFIASNNLITNGFDRGISVDTGEGYAVVANNLLYNNQDGSCVGLQWEGGTPCQFVVANNTALGDHNRLVQIRRTTAHGAVVGNVGRTTQAITGIKTEPDTGPMTITGNYVEGYTQNGIWLRGEDKVCVGNNVQSIGQAGIAVALEATNHVIANNLVRDTGLETGSNYPGIDVASGASKLLLDGNSVENPTTLCLKFAGTDSTIVNNRVSGGQVGIRADGTADSIIANNSIENNTYRNLELLDATRNLIEGNRVKNKGNTNPTFIEEGTSDNNFWTANYAPDDGNTWSLIGAGSNVQNNRPTAGVDVRNFTTVPNGTKMYHDPTVSGDTNTEGEAQYIGGSWISLVDGSTIA